MLQTSSDTEQDTSPSPDVHRQLCAYLTSEQRVAKLHLAIDMEVHQLGVRLPIQNIVKPVDSLAVDDTALVAPVSLPDFCSDWDLPIVSPVVILGMVIATNWVIKLSITALITAEIVTINTGCINAATCIYKPVIPFCIKEGRPDQTVTLELLKPSSINSTEILTTSPRVKDRLPEPDCSKNAEADDSAAEDE